MRQKAALCLLILVFFGACSTAPKNMEISDNPPVEVWLYTLETGRLTKEQFLVLAKGVFAVQKMEVVKIIGCRRKSGMSALARETRKKVDESMREGE
jgi:hypothetical protein